jgi:N-acetylglucosamine kinase-like BadF-type ATPase
MGEVLLGIDGGGTSTVARAECDGDVVFEGVGGPTNVTWNRPAVLVDRLAELLLGCPTPVGAAVCEGMGGGQG